MVPYDPAMVPDANTFGADLAYCPKCGHRSTILLHTDAEHANQQAQLDANFDAKVAARANISGPAKGPQIRKQWAPRQLKCCCSTSNCAGQVRSLYLLNMR
jgi:hypothetical protein